MSLLSRQLKKHAREFLHALRNHKWERNDAGELYFPASKLIIAGVHRHSVNGEDERVDHNLVTNEGILHMLNVELGGTSKVATWYIALSGGNGTPTLSWNAGNYPTNAQENTSLTEGYSETVRQTFVPGAAASGAIHNHASRAQFTMKTATSVSIYGAALSSLSTRGGTTGTLFSAVKYSSARTFADNDIFQCGYEVDLANPS